MKNIKNPAPALIRAVPLPSDLTLTQPVLTMIGTRSLTVENYKSLRQFTEHQIMIQTRHGLLTVQGSHLTIPVYHSSELTITGSIRQISFQ